MSIASEITRLYGVRGDILQAIADKGVSVPSGSKLDDAPELIASISGGGGFDIDNIVIIKPIDKMVVVDANGYIGYDITKYFNYSVSAYYFYYAILDNSADYSQSGLGQVTLVNKEIGSVNIGGRTYKTTKIGNQIWLAENLDYKFDVNGSQIPIGVNGNPSTPAAWYYNNDEAQYGIDGTKKCGLLYNWYAVDYLENNKSSLLPSGWHVASADEWDDLANEVGGVSKAGLVLKSGNLDWANTWGGIDVYEFSSFPTGYRTNAFNAIGVDCGTWTSTENGSRAKNRYFLANTDAMGSNNSNSKEYASPVRLVKDST